MEQYRPSINYWHLTPIDKGVKKAIRIMAVPCEKNMFAIESNLLQHTYSEVKGRPYYFQSKTLFKQEMKRQGYVATKITKSDWDKAVAKARPLLNADPLCW